MRYTKEETLALMKECNLPYYMIEEYRAGNYLPVEEITISKLCKVFKDVSLKTVGYTDDVCKCLKAFYKNYNS